MAVVALVLFAVMFLVVFVARTYVQKRMTGDSGIRAGVLTAAPWTVEWIAGWILLVSTVAALGAPIAELAGLEPLVDVGWVRVTGIVVAGLGIALTFAAQTNMGTEWRMGIDHDEQTGLVSSGAFGLVRNPIFTAMIVATTGLVLIVTNPISVGALVLLVISIEMQVRFVEEPHLHRLHGDEYANYASRVGRFVPRVGRGSGLGAIHR